MYGIYTVVMVHHGFSAQSSEYVVWWCG